MSFFFDRRDAGENWIDQMKARIARRDDASPRVREHVQWALQQHKFQVKES